MDLFRYTHAYRVDALTGEERFERVALPYAGGVAEQPVKTMEALDELERVATTLLTERSKDRELRRKAAERESNRRA